MNASEWQQVREIFGRAANLPSAARQAFLDKACKNRRDIRAEVEKLLQADCVAEQSNFLSHPIWEWHGMNEGEKPDRQIDLPFADADRQQYKVLREIGEGGMGTVYLAYDQRRQIEVAIKVLKAGVAPEDLRRFEEERKILSRLDDHPHLVTLLDHGALRDGRPYFVMKYVRGKSLSEALANGALAFAQVAEITRQSSLALSFAHQMGVIHRDIKPSNIMLPEIGGELNVKVLDFGIAVLRSNEALLSKDFTQGVLCTPLYASPEQLAGRRRDELDHRSDIYSLAIVVYEMLTGRKPFQQFVQSVRLPQTPVPPSQARPDLRIPKTVDRVLAKAMEPKPQDRYEDARQFAADLQAALLTVPAVLPPPENPRRKYLLPVAALLLLAILAAVGWQYLNSQAVGGNANPPTAQTMTNGGESGAITPPTAPPPADTKTSALRGINLQLFRQTKDGEQPVAFDAVFGKGDAVRWRIQAAQDGYLYIVHRGSSGKMYLFYPNPQEAESYERLAAGQELGFPKDSVPIKFDAKAGDEAYYFVFAEKQGEPALAALERAAAQRRVALSDGDGKKLLGELQSRAASREPGPLVRIITLQHR